MIHTLALAVALVLNASANLMIKAAAKGIAAKHPGETVPIFEALKAAVVNPLAMGGVLCFALNLVAYYYALTKWPVSMAYPIMVSVGGAIIVCGAAVWFSEKLTPWQIAGVVVILAGVWLLASGMVKTA